MFTRLVVGFDFRCTDDEINFNQIINHFKKIINLIDDVLQLEKTWYEKGGSRESALTHVAFSNGFFSENTYNKWAKIFEDEYPVFLNGVWDAGDDACSCGISYRKMFFGEGNRAAVELSIVPCIDSFGCDDLVRFISHLTNEFNCSYINVESKGYSVFKRQVFPDRLSAGWMLFLPHVILPELIPEAARVVPVISGDAQKGTIIVSTEDIFDGSNDKHIAKANDIEIRLLDLGLLPLMTEL